ncbi:hypothetical protein STASHLEY_00920 [Brevundimonas phage vB_BpoS-StAshley]|nr:hypothetical protein STASHLEY_00920 [Brevundimonas phage vB_BpoS-StAshley]
MSEQEVEYWWRAEDVTYAPSPDEYGERHGPGTRDIQFTRYQVFKHTPKGVWVHNPNYLRDLSETQGSYHGKSFVLKAQGGKRLCHPTQEDALVSYIARKERQASILAARLADAQAFKALAEQRLSKKVPGWPVGITRGELSDLQFGRG